MEVPETAKTVFAFKALFVEKVVTIRQKRNQLFAGANLTNDILRALALSMSWGHDALPRIRPFCTKYSHSRAGTPCNGKRPKIFRRMNSPVFQPSPAAPRPHPRLQRRASVSRLVFDNGRRTT